MNEDSAAQAWLKATLEADPTLMGMLNGGVYRRSTPKDALTPVVKIDRQEGDDLMVVGMYRVWFEGLYLIRGVAQSNDNDWTTVDAIADRIDTILHRAAGTNSAGTLRVQECRREEAWSDETLEPDLFLHSGGLYRLYAQAL